MSLNILITDKKPTKNYMTGKIVIDDSVEYFDAPLDWWSMEEYQLQWKEGLNRLIHYDTSCLIVAINNPNYRKFIEWWVLYKIGKKIHIQNHIVTSEIYSARIGSLPFTRTTCYNFVPRYRSHTQAGNKISEWVIEWNGILEWKTL